MGDIYYYAFFVQENILENDYIESFLSRELLRGLTTAPTRTNVHPGGLVRQCAIVNHDKR